MARGWESKGVESQQTETLAGRGRRDEATAEERERDSRRQSLEMSRRRIARELESTRSDMRRAQLKAALDHLDREISRV